MTGSTEDGPLSRKTIVVTRTAHQAPRLSGTLRSLGAEVVEVPVITMAPPADGGAALRAAIAELASGAYSWVVFTSANAVERSLDALCGSCSFTAPLAAAKVAAAGPGTVAALRAHGLDPDLVPSTDFGGAGLAGCFPAPTSDRTGRVLLPQAAGAQPELRLRLSELGWQVDAVETYRTMPQLVSPELLAAVGTADAICFASPSAVNAYVDQLPARAGGPLSAAPAPDGPPPGVPPPDGPPPGVPPVVACIGPTTAAAARSRGLAVVVEASEHTVDGLVTTLVHALAGK